MRLDVPRDNEDPLDRPLAPPPGGGGGLASDSLVPLDGRVSPELPPDDGLDRPVEAPATPTGAPPSDGLGWLVGQFARDLATSGLEAVFWRSVSTAADVLAPGAGEVVQAVRVTAGLLDAVESFRAGDGFDLKVPMIGLPGGYSIDLRFRVLDPDQHQVPDLTVNIGWGTAAVQMVQADGDSIAGAVVYEQAAPDRPGEDLGDGADMLTLVGRVLERAHATGRSIAEDAPFAVTFLDHRSDCGWLVVARRDGRVAPYCPIGFDTPRWTPANPEGCAFRCPCCGHPTLEQPCGNQLPWTVQGCWLVLWG